VIDENEIIAKVTTDSIERAAGKFSEAFGDLKAKVSARVGTGFRQSKAASRERYGYVRTLLHRDKPIPLKSLYVPTLFRHDDEEISDIDLVGLAAKPCKILIEGTAGGGKSIFMRYLHLSICDSKKNILPLFFELRNLNNQSTPDLMKGIQGSIKDYFSDISIDFIKSMIRDRQAVLILDGLDEINYDFREAIATQLSDLCKEIPTASIVISSRPDELAQSIEFFSIYHALPFNKKQAVELLGRLPYDETVRNKFIEAVDSELYEKHQDFLSNPLLITMMMITYHQFAEIPSKIHIFYQQAFEALFSWHDSSKDVFKRKSYTNLPIDEFQRVFARFCAGSYLKQTFQFSEVSIREKLAVAIESEMITTSAEKLLKDLMESTCLIQRDGLELVFVHRSFQEYFTAAFISKLDGSSVKRAIDSILKRTTTDLVLPMTYEMNPPLIEKYWTLPTLKSINQHLKKIEKQDIFATMAGFFEIALMHEDRIWLMYNIGSVWGSRIRGLDKMYKHGWPNLDEKDSKNRLSKLKARYKADEHFRTFLIDSKAYADRRNGEELPDNFSLKFKNLDKSMQEYIDVTLWATHLREWIGTSLKEVTERVKSRSESLADLF
jgi:hypothetical protein